MFGEKVRVRRNTNDGVTGRYWRRFESTGFTVPLPYGDGEGSASGDCVGLSVDPQQASADYNQGVLKIKLAKKAEAKPKQIKVNVGAERPSKPKVPARPRKTSTE